MSRPPMVNRSGMSVAQLGIFATAFYIGYVVSNAIGGLATDKIGPRAMMGFALLPLGLFTGLFSFTHSILLGILFQALMGLMAGADYAAGVKLVMTWFRLRDRGTAIGIFMTATSVGVVAANALIPTLLVHAGWPAAYRLLGVTTAIIGIACLILLRDAPNGQEAVPSRSDFRAGAAFVLQDRNLRLLGLAGFGALWGTWGFAFWANALMVRGYGLTPVEAGFIVASFGVGAIAAKPLIGYASDRLGGVRKPLALGCLVVFVVSLIVFGFQSTRAGFQWVAPILGVAAFAYSPMLAALVGETAGKARAGAALGFTNAFGQLGSAIVPLAVGLVFQTTRSFPLAFAALAAGPLIGILLLLPVREPHHVEESTEVDAVPPVSARA